MVPQALRLRVRRDFLRVAAGRCKTAVPGFVIQAAPSPESSTAVRIGFTASKRVGGAVVRNRSRRRLKALARQVLVPRARPGWDYVLIARVGTATRPWSDLVGDLEGALRRIACEAPPA